MTDSIPTPTDSTSRHWMPSLRGVNRRSLKLAITTVVLVIGLGTGAAFAYVKNGSGSGSGTAAVAAAQTITPSASSISGTLYPGGTADLKVTISNPYSNLALTVTGVVGEGTVTASGGSNCTTTGVSVGIPTNINPTTLSAGASNVQVTFSGAIQMSTSSSTGCQGATFTVPVAVTTKVG